MYKRQGYATQTLPINGSTSFIVVLAEDTETLDEVVVLGYGVQKKVNLTGSVASVKGDALEPVSYTHLIYFGGYMQNDRVVTGICMMSVFEPCLLYTSRCV